MPALVSVLIPSYNHGRFLGPCLDSLRSQTFADWEAVLIDDGSTDDSLSIAAAYKDPRIRIEVNPTNLGTYGTLARGLELTSAPLVAVLNSDDLWDRTKLALQVEAMEAAPLVLACYTLGRRIDFEGRIDHTDVHADWPTEPVQETLPFLLTENRILASSVLFRRDSARFNSTLRYSGDWVALLKPAREAPLACVPQPLTFWRMHAANTFVRSPGQLAEEIRVREAILSTAGEWQCDRYLAKDVKTKLGRCALHLSALYVLQGRMADARRAGMLSLKLSRGRESLKRMAAVALPAGLARKKLWPGEGLVPVPDPEELRLL